MQFWLGFITATQILLTAASVYAFWRYAYRPFKVVRADQTAQAQKFAELEAWVKNEVGMRRALEMTDEQRAIAEARIAHRGLYRA